MLEPRLSSELPERFALLYDYKSGMFGAPLDKVGIVDIDALYELAIWTYPDELPDLKINRDNHHVYWTEQEWEDWAASLPPTESDTVTTFRNSTPQIAYVARPIHAWIEESIKRPPRPHMEVMKKRNISWAISKLLLEQAILLDKAVINYNEKKGIVRAIPGYFEGLTPKHKRNGVPVLERTDRDYLQSELERRLLGWQALKETITQTPTKNRIVPTARLAEFRKLEKRIKHGAIVPKTPELLQVA